MDRTTKKIGIILIFIILVPVLFYSVYEISNLDDNEKVIEDIYNSQLEAILFSINQYSEDIVSNWANRVNLNTNLNSADPTLFKENPSLTFLFISDTALSKIIPVYSESPDLIKESEINRFLSGERQNIKRLLQLRSEGYMKLQPAEQEILEDNSLIIFVLNEDSGPFLAGLFFKPEDFIRRILAPKIEAIASEEFVISVVKTVNDSTIYSNDPENNNNPPEQIKSLWLMPEYSLAILLKGDTIESLARDRLFTNVLLIIALNLILFFGIWLIFRNIKKEIQLAQVKSDFVANVSHELRTPLALISMFAETLEMGRVRTEEKKQEYYTIISQETGRLSKIVNKILNFSKMEAGKRNYSFAETDLNEIVNDVFNTYKFHLQNKGFTSELNLYSESLPVKADSEAVAESLINLIDNAIKYSQDKKFIKITTGKNNTFAFIEVEDKGIGITAENKEKIFEKFFRVQSHLVHNTKGTGLGLSIVQHVMNAHKGKISVESTPWQGSTFRLSFPVNENNKIEGN